MSRLSIITRDKAQTTVETLYKDLERRIIASPPGLCPIDLASSFLKMCHSQTCGKCVPCRIGLGQLEKLLEDVLDGKASLETIDLIEKTARTVYYSADCAIGYEAANMVLKGIEGFRDDFEEHILHGRCTFELYQPVPCEESCPVNAITKDVNGIEHIDPDKCIYCGKCMVACPFGAIMEKTFMVDVFKEITDGKKVVAIVAPSLGGQFKSDYRKVLSAIKQLGFDQVIEVAKGANITTENEREELIERLHEGAPFMTTSCCPSWMNLVYKHIPEMKPYVSTTSSPMVYTANLVKKENPDAITVFFSPCVGKRSEAFRTDEVDFVITYEELEALIKAAEINIDECEITEFDSTISGHGRGYAMISGVVESVKQTLPDASIVNEIVIDGLNKSNIRQLKQYAQKGECPGNFIEIMSCPGGCVNGCDTINNPKAAARTILTQVK